MAATCLERHAHPAHTFAAAFGVNDLHVCKLGVQGCTATTCDAPWRIIFNEGCTRCFGPSSRVALVLPSDLLDFCCCSLLLLSLFMVPCASTHCLLISCAGSSIVANGSTHPLECMFGAVPSQHLHVLCGMPQNIQH